MPATLSAPRRHLDAADVAVFVVEDLEVDEAVARQVVREGAGLLSAELEEERAAAAEIAGAVDHDTPEDLGAVAAAVVRQRCLEHEGVALQERQRRRRYVRHDADHHVDASDE